MDVSNSGFNRFFNSDQFGPRFFMVINLNPLFCYSLSMTVIRGQHYRHELEAPRAG
jgi:hypothetical protein